MISKNILSIETSSSICGVSIIENGNLLGISNFAMSSLWQQWRDEASWTNEAAQNSLNRAHNMASAALERQTAFDLNDQASRDNLFQLLGQYTF